MEWDHTTSPKKQLKRSTLSWHGYGKCLWDGEGCILVDFLEKGETINAAHYVQTLKKHCHVLCEKHLKKTAILQHDNTRPHTAHLTLQTIQKNGW
jgi:hypothetical protein